MLKTKIICEIGTNFKNLDDILFACETITSLGGIPKLQAWKTDKFVNKKRNPQHFKKIKEYEIPRKWMKIIKREFPDAFYSVFDLDTLKFLETEIKPKTYKIASPDCVFDKLVEAVGKTGRPTYISVGGATLDEIRHCVKVLNNSLYLTLMSCVASYPCDNAHLGDLRDRINGSRLISWGYSSHSLQTCVPAFAVILGAVAVEVHVKMNEFNSPDNNHSFNVYELNKIIELIKIAEENLGTGERPLDCEKANLALARRKRDGKR